MNLINALPVAIDGGARDTLQPVAAACALELAPSYPAEACDSAYWSRRIALDTPSLLVTGTSDSIEGRRIELAARRAANHAGLPIAAIEDFPGSYSDEANGARTLVIVESTAARHLAMARFGARRPRIEVFAPARYDRYRERLAPLRDATAAQWAAHDGAHAAAVLWAGQPETDDALRTLGAILPALVATGAHLLFKAHPRDTGYAAGAYQALLRDSGVAVADVTHLDVAAALARAPHLVLTQFSSLAIEAGFFGIPSLWILLPDAGGARLAQNKGYRTPPLLTMGAAGFTSDAGQMSTMLDRALQDDDWRADTLRRFDEYFAVGKLAAPALVERLRELA